MVERERTRKEERIEAQGKKKRKGSCLTIMASDSRCCSVVARFPSFAGDAAAVVVAVAVAGACGGCRGVVWWSVELLTPVLHGSYIPVA